MKISSDSLKILLETNRYPAAIFDIDQCCIASNALFNEFYEYNDKKKTLLIKNASYEVEYGVEVDFTPLFKEELEKKYLFIHHQLYAIISKLHSENQNECGWVITLKQEKIFFNDIKEKLCVEYESFKNLAHYLPLILWITTPDGHLTYVNKYWEEYTGLNYEQTIAGQWTDVIYPDDLDTISESWNKAYTQGDRYETEFRMKRASDGMFRWHLVSGVSVKNEMNEVLYWIGYTIDIHNVRLIEKDLNVSERRYHTLVQSLHSIYWRVDSHFKMHDVQASWQSFSGQEVHEYKNLGWLNAIHPDDREKFINEWKNAAEKKQIYQHIARFFSKKKNDYIYCILRAAPLIEENQNIIKWIVSCLDIDEQKRNEIKLKELRDYMNLALISVNAGMWRLDLKNFVPTWGENTYRLFGLKQDTDFNEISDFTHLVHPLDRNKFIPKIKEHVISKKTEFTHEYRVIWPDKSVHRLRAKGRMYIDDNGIPYKMIGITRDVTDEHRKEKIIQSQRKKISNEIRRHSINELASSLAHEVNQPITATLTYLQTCINKMEKSDIFIEQLLEGMKKAKNQAERASQIIYRMKNSIKNRALYLEKVNIEKFIKQTFELLDHIQYEDKIQLKYLFSNELPDTCIDKIQIQQVIINLINNSIEALESIENQFSEIIIKCEFQNSNIIISILDNGPGFPKEILKSKTSAFTTKVNGMGIGLSICKNIVEAHYGKFNLYNNLNNYTVAEIILPYLGEVP